MTKADVTINVDSVSDTTTLVGEDVTIEASVVPDSPGSGTPTGDLVLTVSPDAIFGDSNDIDITETLSGGSATFIYAFPDIGTWRWIISYAGSSNYNSDETSTATQTVSRGSVTISNIAPGIPYSNSIDTSITFSARINITSPASGELDGQVRFTLLAGGSSANNRYCDDITLENHDGYALAQCSIVASVRGDLSLRVAFSNDSNFNDQSTTSTASYDITGIPTITEITSASILPASPSTFGTSVTVPFTVTPDSEPQNLEDTDTVTVTARKSGAADIAVTATIDDGEAVISFTEAGTWQLVAKYNGNTRLEISESTPVTHIVRYPTTSSLGSYSHTIAPSVLSDITVYFPANVGTSIPDVGVPEGSVTITASKSGSTDKVCSSTLNGTGYGNCGIAFSNSDVGTWTITLSYPGTTDYWGPSQTTDTLEVQ